MDKSEVQAFIDAHGIEVSSWRARANPNMPEARDMAHWRVELTGRDTVWPFNFWFSQAAGYNGAEPTAEDVLGCLLSDASSLADCDGFEDWAENFGFSSDSISALRAFEATEETVAELYAFLGPLVDEALALEPL